MQIISSNCCFQYRKCHVKGGSKACQANLFRFWFELPSIFLDGEINRSSFKQNVGASETILFRTVNLAQSGLFYVQKGKKKRTQRRHILPSSLAIGLTLYDYLRLGHIISPNVHTQV